jgi:hypothetical protein
MQTQEPFSYEERYGVRTSRPWIPVAVLLGLLGIGWTVWAGLHFAAPDVRSTLYSFSITGEKEITMRYGIERKNPDAQVTCTLIAYDYDKNVVGQIDDVFIAGVKKEQHNTAIPARSTPVSGAISDCQIR